MSNYVKATNFTAKDSLPTGNSGKIVKGAEIDTEFTAIASAISSKADINSPALTGTPTAPTASAGTNTTQIATTAFVVANAIPSGLISMWSGTIASIPSGWVLCNGSNSTPDLRNKFIIGAHSDNAGVANTTVTGENTLTGGSKDAIVVSHTHTFSGTTSGQSADHTHNQYGLASNGTGGGGDPGQKLTATGNSVATSGTSNDHTHTYSGTTASTGDSGTNANLVPYYALAYIMKT
jgi:microcystin-dependent protein